ncbi:putative Phosphatase 1 regulatory subunit [Giardia muris]|uniref:Putative Phosphatase 1 regulatory subunit n=1 Tax=Giardia muris TaxID=5742 RepID=A0A4Z1SRK8_GIAMU|nr:putative Phosphatase 1 regulatory subunit [Giardia muris]|eukprot:TNJ28532.1 putative Phosphatase 1 regulatory subunit [Giardia muris]
MHNCEEKDERRMTPKVLRKICLQTGGYSTPGLNEIAYFHFKGFQRIEGLEEYTALKSLWLEGNGLMKIENLEPLQNLVCLFLQENLISTIENLSNIPSIRQLNLASNQVRQVKDGLWGLHNLETLNLSGNMLESYEDLLGLVEATGPDGVVVPVCQNVSVLDLSRNRIETPDIVKILNRLPNLKVLNLMNNPLTRSMSMYRKTVIHACPNLTYLDDRPVFDDERRAVTAYFRGGPEAELAERRLCLAEKRAEESAQFVSMRAFLHGKPRDECIALGNAERERYMRRFHETGEVDQFGRRQGSGEHTIADIAQGRPIWRREEVPIVSRAWLEKRVPVTIEYADDPFNMVGNDIDSSESTGDVPELEEVPLERLETCEEAKLVGAKEGVQPVIEVDKPECDSDNFSQPD